MPYVRGWLVGTDMGGGHLIPFELAARAGPPWHSFSGPVGEDLASSLQLSRWCVDLALGLRVQPPREYQLHLNLPLHHASGAGPSARLAFAYALLEMLGVVMPSPVASTAVTGDLTLGGTVVAVEDFELKHQAVMRAGLHPFVVPASQAEARDGMLAVATIEELIGT
jgi:ATP-dependent Lon protease